MNITIEGENSKLPKIYITKAILQNDSISVTLSLEENNESGISNFSNTNYFKYLKIGIAIETPTNVVINTSQINQLPTDIVVSFTNIDTTNALNIKYVSYFDSNSYISDNNIEDVTLQSTIKEILGFEVVVTYPVLYSQGELYNQLLDIDGNTVQSIVSDFRSVTSLENLKLVSPFRPEENPVYFNFIKSDVVGSKVNNFVSFNYKKFLRNNSYFSSDSFDNFTMQISISNSLKNLDNIIIAKLPEQQTTPPFDIIYKDKFISSNSTKSVTTTKLISKTDEIILFYFEDNNVMNVDEYSTLYTLKVTYADQTYSRFYNAVEQTGLYYDVFNQYSQFRNKVFLAQKFSDYPDNPNIKQPFYLDLSSDRFTNEFVSFCERDNVNLRSLITNLITIIINPFLSSEEQLTTDTIEKIISSLQFDVSTYSLYTSFFKTVDNIFMQIKDGNLDKTRILTKIYNKKSSVREKVNSSFFLLDEINNDGIPKLKIDVMKDILNRYDTKTNTIRPKYISNNKEKHEITDSLEFDSLTFNHISSFVKSLQDKKKLNLSSELITEDSYLHKLGVTLTISDIFDMTLPKFKSLTSSSNKTELFRTGLVTTAKKGLKSNKLSLRDISKADQNLKSKIKQTNQFSHALHFSTFKLKSTKEEMTPKLYLFYYDEEVDGYWSRLTKFTTISKNMLIKIEKDLEEETIFTKTGIPVTNVPLENTYFILE